ncbi:MAG: phosphoenolpyruvate carboxykinase (GTP) [Candidatus Bathyarchaeota archaeon]|nr:MAG: phosphoenolpyruvate carboxykinase (GTP) [Candidatus Bathyarchaeota archaeon]
MPLSNFLLRGENLHKLVALENPHVIRQVRRFIDLCKPVKVTVIGDDPEEIAYVRQLSLDNGEEVKLKMEGHTIHFDGFHDQARDKGHTAVLLPFGERLSRGIVTLEREEGLKEVLGLLDGSMKGKECLIRFFSLGPTNSRFSLCALQITDSAYVAHSEDLLYRSGYEQFKRLKGSHDFFTFIHSAGELDERSCTKNVDKRRIYIDHLDGKVYSVNNQYAGNSLGLKKLALRLAIYRANHEGWLAEHMLVMGVHPPRKKRVTYFTGAYPSACGKTSTAMIPGQTIVGDDIAYLKIDEDGNARAVNIESGIFGIIKDVNPVDDPLIYKALTTPRELIFSNVLIVDDVPYWQGMGRDDIPESGVNFSGEWWKGKKDDDGREIPFAHSNARYTMRISELENADPKIHDPDGVIVQGIFYGGRDSDTNVPIYEALSWEHGVYLGATIESETTSATLGQEGVRKSNPMANMDFLVIPLGTYLRNHIEFGRKLRNRPRVFSTNYFLKHEGVFTNEILDKKVWVIWAEGRVHGEYDAIKTPIGYLPKYKDLRDLFRQVFDREYTLEEYHQQFSVRLDKFMEKIARMEAVYRTEPGMPREFGEILNQQKSELEVLKAETGKSTLTPEFFI